MLGIDPETMGVLSGETEKGTGAMNTFMSWNQPELVFASKRKERVGLLGL